MGFRYHCAVTLVFTLIYPIWVAASDLDELDVSGFIGTETRIFFEDAQFFGQGGHGEVSLVLSPEFRYAANKGTHKFSFGPFARIDSRDQERSHFDIREAYWLASYEDFEILLGFNRVFWGVAESRHLINIINQVDLVEDIDQEDFLGQPMINLRTYQNFGQVDLFVLPGFRERTFPGEKGRFRFSLPIDNNPKYTSSYGQKHIDVALRYSHYFGNWDVGAYYFYGTGREPRFILDHQGDKLRPVYDIIHQGGVDMQYTRDAWLYKFEGIVQSGRGQTFAAMVAGAEFTFYQVFDSADIGILLEYLYDGRSSFQPPTIFENDIFVGFRLALNDAHDTSVLAATMYDPSSGEIFINIEAERRLGQNFAMEIQARFFTGSDASDANFAFAHDDYIRFNLAYYF